MPEYYIGLMSGTSMDAIDAVLVDLAPAVPRLIAAQATPLAPALRDELITLAHSAEGELERLARLDVEMGRMLAAAVDSVLQAAAVPASAVRAVGSHGQTVRHAPHGSHPYTLQIGDPNIIAHHCGLTTIADFRRRDIAAGGQGAPLVPAFHAQVFGQAAESRVVVNIGGMANLTILPANADEAVVGFDSGPGNVLMDAWAQRHLGQSFDANGDWARGGHIVAPLLQIMLEEPYFHSPAPKSTGRETFNLPWLERLVRALDMPPRPRDVQTTLLALTVDSIVAAIHTATASPQRVLVCGGGTHNSALMAQLQRKLPAPVESTQAHGLDPDWVEAIAFAWLAKRTLDGLPGNLPSVTGARCPVILGAIYPGRSRG